MKTRMTKWQKIGLCAAGLAPVLLLLLGLFLWLPGNAVLTLSYAVALLILPALCLFLLWLTICSRRQPLTKWIFSILILGLTAFLFVAIMFVGHFSIYGHANDQKALQRYEQDIGEYELLPEISDLGEPEKIEYHYFYNLFFTIFDSDCYTLICTYSPGDYASMTAELDSRYTFHTEPLDAGDTELPPLYTLKGYQFRFLEMDTETYNLWYPKYMILVGTNDETHEIVWSYYDDDDLDYISDPEDFLLDDCGWKFIR